MSATPADVVEYQVGTRWCVEVKAWNVVYEHEPHCTTRLCGCSWCRPGRAASLARRRCRGSPSPGSSPSPRSPPGRSLATARRAAAAAVLRYQPGINVVRQKKPRAVQSSVSPILTGWLQFDSRAAGVGPDDPLHHPARAGPLQHIQRPYPHCGCHQRGQARPQPTVHIRLAQA